MIVCECGRPKSKAARMCHVCERLRRQRMRVGMEASRHYHEPTEEELDAMIAEQLANKPAWWDDERNDECAIFKAYGERRR